MNKEFYFHHLYPLQDEIFVILKNLDTSFYLTGGTASSRGYLQHRFSEDLDYFVNDRPEFNLWCDRVIHALAENSSWSLEIVQREERFGRLFLKRGDLSLKIELVNDVPSHVGVLRKHDFLGLLDSPENILANKVTAAIGREEPKDLADIWGFCTKMKLSLADALENAGSKAAGVFPADLARVLASVTAADWQSILWIDAPQPEHFLRDLKILAETLLLP